ncbi:MAG: methyltransferase domain-containing protein [Flavisolibacter sp.]
MHEHLLELLRCPVTRTSLRLEVISKSKKTFNEVEEDIIYDGILFAEKDWFYPIVNGIPRLIVEAFIDYEEFFNRHLPDYGVRRSQLKQKYPGLVKYVLNMNSHTKKSFTQEWNIFNFQMDKTWGQHAEGMIARFLKETNESETSIIGKLIFDAGCGNGLLNQLIARKGGKILGMDFSRSIEKAFRENTESGAWFIQGDVQFPPVIFESFDIVHSSGVLIHTSNTELSFSCLEPCVKSLGKLSVWLYHPRKDIIHNLFNFIRRFSSRLPLKFQYYLYRITVFPITYVVKRAKGNKQNSREMMVDILDWFTPEFRWEHGNDEAATWFYKRNYESVKVTTTDLFGFNIMGIKKKSVNADRNI